MLDLGLMLASLAMAAPPAAPAFVAARASGAPVHGTVARLDADLTVTFEGEAAAAVIAGDLVSLRRRDRPLPPPPAGPQLVFANGDRLAGEVVAIEHDRVRFRATLGRQPDDAQVLSVPLSALAVIWFRAPPSEVGADPARRWAGERRRRDVVLTRNGDTRSGTVKEMKSAAGPLVFRDDGGETRLDPAQVVAVAMNSDLARTLRPRGAFARLVLADGSRLGVLAPAAGPFALTAKALFGDPLKVKLDEVVSLDVRQGRAVHLSDLKPKAYEHRPYLGVRWPYGIDSGVAGGPLLLAGSTYDKGIGLHAESRLTFALDGRYRRFEALVGLDDQAGRGGRAVARVLVDGKPSGDLNGELNSAGAPRPVEVDVTGARELTLVVEFGPGGDVGDHVNWADARLIKSP